jgi:hypothetical protein
MSHDAKHTRLDKLALCLVLLVATILASADDRGEKRCISTLKAQTLDLTESTDYAQSALEAIRKGDSNEAIVVLEAQLSTGATLLHATYPQLEKNGELSVKESSMIKQVITNADSYKKKYHLKD